MIGFFKKKVEKTITFTITIVIEPDNDRFYAYCPAFKGLHVEGTSVEDACENAKDAAFAYLASLIKHGEPIPVGIEIKEEYPLTPPSIKHIHQIPVTI